MDVTDPESVAGVRDQIQEHIGGRGLDGLVNNAGIGVGGPLEYFPLDTMREIFEVNLFGVLAVTQAFLPMLRQARGRVVNISSTASQTVAPFHGPYTASKCALNAITQSMRMELLPHGVHVCVVICGSVATPIWKKGGELSSTVTQAYPPEALELYGAAYKQLGKYFRALGTKGAPTEDVAKVITRALIEEGPKNTYLAGKGARSSNLFDKLFYGKLRERMILRRIGIEV
jgi:NAD(P)-dependent dehydrogenase (short-subunit alcohol dehydrogenase family)